MTDVICNVRSRSAFCNIDVQLAPKRDYVFWRLCLPIVIMSTRKGHEPVMLCVSDLRLEVRYNLLIFDSNKVVFFYCKFCDCSNVFYVDLYFASLIDES